MTLRQAARVGSRRRRLADLRAELSLEDRRDKPGGSLGFCRNQPSSSSSECAWASRLRTVLVAVCVLALLAADIRPALADPKIDRSIEAAAKDLVTPETQQAIDAGLAFLAARQDSRDGSFGTLASSRRRVAVTALAGMAFLSSGSTPGRGKYGAQVQKAVDFLLSRFQPNGFIFDEGNTGHGPMYDHGFATLFLAEVYGMTRTPRVRNSLERAVQLIVNSQNKEGGWRYEPDSKDADLSVTICEVMALRAARNAGIFVPKETIDRCTDYVHKCQTPEGGFRYQLATTWQVTFGLTAAGVVALYSAGVYEGKSIEAGLRYIERYRPGLAHATAGQPLFLQSLLRHAGDVARRRRALEAMVPGRPRRAVAVSVSHRGGKLARSVGLRRRIRDGNGPAHPANAQQLSPHLPAMIDDASSTKSP